MFLFKYSPVDETNKSPGRVLAYLIKQINICACIQRDELVYTLIYLEWINLPHTQTKSRILDS
jgi:hypothetical protein